MLKSSGVKIVATLGPSINNEETIEELIKSGASMFRVNSSHSTPEEHKANIEMVRKVAKKLNTNTAVLLDLQGPKIRVGNLKEPIELVEDSEVELKHSLEQVDETIPVDYSGIAKDVKKGDTIYEIAQKYNLNPAQLAKLNGLKEGEYIYPGDEIYIPKKNTGFYITGANDTLNYVANALQITPNNLANQNPTIYLLEDQLIVYKK